MKSFADKLIFGAYTAAWKAAAPFLKRHHRLKDGFADRLVPPGWPGEADKAAPAVRFWIQAASGGESWLVHALAPALARAVHARSQAQGIHCLCTTFTRQGLDVLQKPMPSPGNGCPPPSILPRYFPLDTPALMQRAICAARPDAIILLETELWPGLLSAAREAGVPVFIVNGRMRESSRNAYGRIASLWKKFPPDRVLAVSEDDAARFAGVFGIPEHCTAMNNIKFDLIDNTPLTAQIVQDQRSASGIPPETLLAVLASVREEEEDLLLPLLPALVRARPGGLPRAVAVAPRHMHRVAAWQEKLAAAGLAVRLRSEDKSRAGTSPVPPATADIYLWDTFGELQTLYGAADTVFVGGSLAPLGGQNFIEAAALGIAPLVGPSWDNFLWAGDGLFTLGAARQVASAAELGNRLKDDLDARDTLFSAAGMTPAANNAATAANLRTKATAERRDAFSRWLAPRKGGADHAAQMVAARIWAVRKASAPLS